jgi:hypothetical protein
MTFDPYTNRIPHMTAAEESIAALPADDRVAKLVEALEEIAKQKRTDELDNEYEVECADFEDGYDFCVDRARAALAAWEAGK